MRRLVVCAALLWLGLTAGLVLVARPQQGRAARLQLGERSINQGAVQFSPDGRLLAYPQPVGDRHTVEIWDIERDTLLRSLLLDAPAALLAFNHDHALLATLDHDGNALVWDVETGARRLVLNRAGVAVRTLTFHPDGSPLAVVDEDGATRLWDTARGVVIAERAADGGATRDVRFSRSGALLASAGAGQSMMLWEYAAGESRAFTNPYSVAQVVLFTPDDRFALTYGSPGYSRLWDVSTGQIVSALNYLAIYTAAAAADGAVLIAGKRQPENQLHVVDLTTRTERYTVGAARAAFSPDGAWLATASGRYYRDGVRWGGGGLYYDANEVWLWHVATRRRYVIFRGCCHVERLWFSPDGSRLAFLNVQGALRVVTLNDISS